MFITRIEIKIKNIKIKPTKDQDKIFSLFDNKSTVTIHTNVIQYYYYSIRCVIKFTFFRIDNIPYKELINLVIIFTR